VSVIAYLLLPITGVLVFLLSYSERARFHALQSIVFGTAWALLLYAGALIGARVTQAVFILGVLAWLTLIVATWRGRDLRLPLVGGYLEGLAGADSRIPSGDGNEDRSDEESSTAEA
jgi:uncharacterized membrane protein